MYILDVKMPVQLLQTLVQVFESDYSVLTLIGGLSQLDTHLLENVTFRDWPASGGDRSADIPLTQKNVQVIVESILPRVGIRTNVYEVAISNSHEAKLLFSAIDNFYPVLGIEGTYNKGALVASRIDVQLLDDLVEKQIIRKYLVVDPPSDDWA